MISCRDSSPARLTSRRSIHIFRPGGDGSVIIPIPGSCRAPQNANPTMTLNAKKRAERPVASVRQPYGPRADNRRDAVLAAAARLFANAGYAGTSMRDIAAEAGMLGGSVYYHFKTKADLLLEAHQLGITRYASALAKTLEEYATADPWQRFGAACRIHLQCIHDSDDYSRLVRADFTRQYPLEVHAALIAQRDAYERVIVRLVSELPLKKSVDRRVFRLTAMGALNSSRYWYRPGQKSPARIAEEIVEMLKFGVAA